LKLFEKYEIKASWFIPGHTLETFPEECAMVRDAGHEIGVSSKISDTSQLLAKL
jgi:peptidoglycan/xylan/chitin deacetylase (PgdA/CDA1 family)